MASDEIADSNAPPSRKKEDLLHAQIDRDLEEPLGAALAYAREKSKEPFWPIGLCVAWALRADVTEAVVLYARHRVGLGVREVESWRQAQLTLIRALAGAQVEASGMRPDDGKRVSVPPQDWIDLSIVQRGQFDEVRRPDGSIAYRDVRIEARAVHREWPPETAAATKIRDRIRKEKACLVALIEQMKVKPTHPVPKAQLRPKFPGVSERGFEKLYSQAVRESGSVAWSKGGRRPSKKE
jgi:hypothetical protein